jgi:hypothetical protein
MADDVTTTDTTTPADDDGATWRDGSPLDPQRLAVTLVKLRTIEKDQKAQIRARDTAITGLLAGQPVPEGVDVGQASAADAEIQAVRGTLRALGATFGLDADTISGEGGRDAPTAAARAAAISGPLARATAKAGVDHDLAAALLVQSGALASLDLARSSSTSRWPSAGPAAGPAGGPSQCWWTRPA